MHYLPLAALIVLLSACPSAAGPWPRGEGNVFVSVRYEGRIDLDRLPLYTLHHGGSVYAEYGLSPRTTIGLDVYSDFDRTHASILFVRRTLTRGDAAHQFAVTLGLGTRADAAGEQGLVLAGASWGRGFASRWGDGWMQTDAQARLWESGDSAVKLDTALGLRPWTDWMLIGQLQMADYPGSDTTARLQATVVRRISDRFSIEAGVLLGVLNDDLVGLTVGLWSEY